MKLLLLSIRSLRRFKLYSAINMAGLALSLACTTIIGQIQKATRMNPMNAIKNE